MLKVLIFSFFGCLFAFSQEKKTSPINMDGWAFIPIVIIVDVGLPDKNGEIRFTEHEHTKKLRFQWSGKSRIVELDPTRMRPLDKNLAKPRKPTLIDENNSATIWTQCRWGSGGNAKHVSYGFNGNLKITTDKYTVIDKPLRHFIRNANKKPLNFGAILVHIQLTIDKKTGLLKEYNPKPPETAPVIDDNENLLPRRTEEE